MYNSLLFLQNEVFDSDEEVTIHDPANEDEACRYAKTIK